MTPDFQLIANGSDITALVMDRYARLSLTDKAGGESDMLEIVLADTDPLVPLRKPPRGAELQLFIGYRMQLVNKGIYTVDEVQLSGWPGALTIRARAAQMQDSKGGKSALQSQKTRNWEKNTKLGAVVRKIAKEHGMQAVVAKSLEGITLPHIDQTEEGDLSFLQRIAKKHDAFVKPGGGKLALIKRGESKTASGEDMPDVVVLATECSRWSMNESAREEDGTVVAFWHDKNEAKRQSVSVGSGDPVRKMRHNYPNSQAAKAAAQAEYDKRVRGKSKFTCTMPGNPSLAAEGVLKPSGFHPDVPQEWVIESVVHEFTPGGGYVCDIEAELPNQE